MGRRLRHHPAPWLVVERLAVMLLTGSALASLASAAPKTLAELTPADTGACLVIDGLAPAVEQFVAGPHWARWRRLPPLEQWMQKHRPGLQRLVGEASEQLGIDSQVVWREVFGNRMLLAVWPSGQPAGPSPGLLIVEASNEATLAQLIEGVRRAQRRAGEVVASEQRQHAGMDYQARTLKRGETQFELFLAVSGRIAVVASHEHLIQQVLARLANQSDVSTSLAKSPGYQAALAEADPAATLFAYINSRSWDAALAKDASHDKTRPDHRLLLEVWRATRCWSFSARLSPHLAFEGQVHMEPVHAARGVRDWIGGFARKTDALSMIPADCLIGVAGSIDVARLLEQSRHGLDTAAADATKPDDHERAATDQDRTTTPPADTDRAPLALYELFDRAFHGIGPGVFGYVVRTASEERDLPLDVAIGIETSRRAPANEDPLESVRSFESLRTLLLASVSLMNLQPNSPPLRLETVDAQPPMLSIAGVSDLPRGWQPTFAAAGRRLLAGSSRDVVRQSAGLTAAESLANSPALAEMLDERWPQPEQVLVVDMAALHDWLSLHGKGVVSLLHPSKESESNTARQQRGIEQVRSVLKLADTFLLAADVKPSRLRMRAVLRIESTSPK